MRRALAAGVACAVAIALAHDARANGRGFELDYDAPAACPSEAAFLADVRTRLADRRLATTDGRQFRVWIVEDDGAYRGALETLEPPSVREVAGDSCEEVSRALVVFLALALSPAEPPSSASSPPPVSPEPAPRVEPRAPAPPPPTVETAPSLRPAFRPRVGAGARALAAVGVAPGIAPGGSLDARFELETRPSMRWVGHAGAALAYEEKSALGGAFCFLWSVARIDAGPALDLGRARVSAGPVVHAGSLSVRARSLPAASRYAPLWVDVGAFARVDYPLAKVLAVSLMVELAAPLRRWSFGIQGVEAPVHEIPPVIGVFSFGVSVLP